ncbi:MAG: DUF4352 domain-containing protein [Gulosibacter sp.]|uniref:DUF4352 domain-containing protein n=1 Tax=Gulosibacter sp. TaxID=2817531 RepID=UPI003F938ACF
MSHNSNYAGGPQQGEGFNQPQQGNAQGAQQYPQQPLQPPQQPAKKKNWFARHKVLTGIGAAVLLIVFISAVSGGGSDDSAEVPAAEQDSSAVAEQEAAPAEDGEAVQADAEEPADADAVPNAAGIGDTVVSGDLEFTITGVESGVTEVGSEYLNSTPQGVYYLVHVEVTNTGDSAEYFSSSNQVLIDDQGREHETDGSASLYIEDNDVLFTDINPGNTAVGTLVFDLPADAAPVEIHFGSGLFSDDAVVSLSESA